jgi:hypothetical protein
MSNDNHARDLLASLAAIYCHSGKFSVRNWKMTPKLELAATLQAIHDEAARHMPEEIKQVETTNTGDHVLRIVEAGWFRYDLKRGEPLPAEAQMINGEWWSPRFGCDSLNMCVDAVREILPNASPKVTLDAHSASAGSEEAP